MNIGKVCRFCLTASSFTSPIFTKIVDGGQLLVIQIYECLSIKLSDEEEMQSLICNECHAKFSQFSLFKQKCLVNDRIFRQVKVNLPDIKQEVKEQFDDHYENQFEYTEFAQVDMKEESNDYDFEPSVVHEESLTYNPKVYVCNECGASLKGRRKFKHHIKIHFPSSYHRYIKNFECKFCLNKYMTQDSMETHILKYHNEDNVVKNIGRKPKVCHVCGKTFKKKYDLNHHILTHDNLKPFQCDECGMSFGQPGTLKAHKTTHMTTADCICEYCNKAFKTDKKLNVHRRLHTGKPYQCERCEKSYLTSYALKMHLKSHDKIMTQCSFCGEIFKSVSAMAKHRSDVHQNEMEFECQLCSKRFIDDKCLKVHLKTHQEDLRSKCPECDRTFCNRETMRKHLKRTHPESNFPE